MPNLYRQEEIEDAISNADVQKLSEIELALKEKLANIILDERRRDDLTLQERCSNHRTIENIDATLQQIIKILND